MDTTTLGADGPRVSRQGLGCMGMSEFYGPTDDEQSLATLNHALDIGVTHLDTADMYGSGANERLLSRLLDSRREEVFLATKFGIVRDASDASARGVRGDAEYVRSSCDASLRRLGVDVIDLYYMHRVDTGVAIEETVGAMAELVTAGKVRHLGLSEVTADELERAHAIHPITAVQGEWSLFSRDVEPELIPACVRLGVGFVSYSPLGRGFLTGAVTSTDNLTDADFRRNAPRFADGAAQRNAELLRPVREIAETHSLSPGQVALAWVHQRGDVWNLGVSPIPGTRRVERLDENAAAARVRLSDAELEHLDAIAGQVEGDRYADMGSTFQGRSPQ